MRLTEKCKNNYVLKREMLRVGKDALLVANELTDKLGQLEDIEEELGIELLTLFKAIGCGCYFKNKDNEIVFANDIVIGYKYIVIVESSTKYMMWNTNYGKTWALTKEELK